MIHIFIESLKLYRDLLFTYDFIYHTLSYGMDTT